MTAARKPSMSALVRQLAKDGVPVRVRQTKDGETIIETLTIPPAAAPDTDMSAEVSRLIHGAFNREVRPKR